MQEHTIWCLIRFMELPNAKIYKTEKDSCYGWTMEAGGFKWAGDCWSYTDGIPEGYNHILACITAKRMIETEAKIVLRGQA